MPGPWEKFQDSGSPQAVADSGPWAKYQDPTGNSVPFAQHSGEIPAENVQHPDINFTMRAVLQNLGNSPDAKAKYLNEHGFEAVPQGKEVLVKKPGEEKYKKLAPAGLELQDITDSAYPAASGIASAAAGTAAAIPAAAATGGIAALPAAAATSGVVGGGLEALRQKLGQWAGIPQEVNMQDVGREAAVSAAAPVLFGAGSNVAKQGLAKVAEQGVLPSAYRGVKNALPAVAEMVSGVPAQATKTLATRGEELANLGENGVQDYAQAAHEKLVRGLAERKRAVGQNLEKAIRGAQTSTGETPVVDLSGAKAKLDELISKMETGNLKDNPQIKEQIAALKEARNSIFKEVAGTDEAGKPILTEMSNEVSPGKAFDLQDLLADMSDFSKNTEGPMSRLKGTRTEKQWTQAAADAYKDVNHQLSKATEGLSADLKGQYADYTKLQKDLQNNFKTPEQTYKTLSNLDSPNKQYLRERLTGLKEQGIDLTPEVDLLQANKYYTNPSLLPISSKGTTSTSRSLGMGTLGGAIGYKIGGYPVAQTGVAIGSAISGPRAIKAYTNALSGVDEAIPEAIKRYTAPALKYTSPSIWKSLEQKNKRSEP